MGARPRLRVLVLLAAAVVACGDNRSLPVGDGGLAPDAGPQGPCVPRLGDPVVRLPPATPTDYLSVIPYDLVIGDLDGDGLPDIFRSGLTGGDNGGWAFWAVFINQGGGTFTQRQVSAGGGHFAMGDVSGDGAPDLVAWYSGAALVNDGAGWLERRDDVVSVGLYPLALGDLDGDGHLDVVGMSAAADGSPVVFLRNLGDGSFAPPQTIASGAGAIALGDVDGDGRLDVVVGTAADRTVVVLRQGPDGTFAGAAWEFAGAADAATVAAIRLADLDGDGRLDLLVLSQGAWSSNLCAGDNLAVRLSTGDGEFGPLATYRLGQVSRPIAVGDLDGDGTADVARLEDDGTLSLFFSDGRGALGAPVAYSFADLPRSYLFNLACNPVAIADVDADGRLDVVVPGGVLLNRGCAR
jgi:hypothetical protein